MPYCSASNTASFCTDILAGKTQFDNTTDPTLTQINMWLSSGCAVIESKLASYRYVVPVAQGTVAYDMLSDLNALYAAARAEMTKAVATLQLGERTKGQVLDKMFWDELNQLCQTDLTYAGVQRNTGQVGKLYAGGTNRADVDMRKNDSSTVKSRIQRDQFRFPGQVNITGAMTSAS
jgi:hypothetical protein